MGNASAAIPYPPQIAEQDILYPGSAVTLPLLFLSVLSAAAESSPAVTAAELGDSGGQDLFNFSFSVKASLLLSDTLS